MRPARPISGGWLLQTSRTRNSVCAMSSSGNHFGERKTPSATSNGSASTTSSAPQTTHARRRAYLSGPGGGAASAAGPPRSGGTGAGASATAVSSTSIAPALAPAGPVVASAERPSARTRSTDDRVYGRPPRDRGRETPRGPTAGEAERGVDP